MINFSIVNGVVYLPVGADLYKTSISLTEMTRIKNLINSNPEVLARVEAMTPTSKDLDLFKSSCYSISEWLYKFWSYKGFTVNGISTGLIFEGNAIISRLSTSLGVGLIYGNFHLPSFDLLATLVRLGMRDFDEINAITDSFDILSNKVRLLVPTSQDLNSELLEIDQYPYTIEHPVSASFSLDLDNLPNKVYTIACDASDLSSINLDGSTISISNGTLLGVHEDSMNQINTFTKMSCTIKKLLTQTHKNAAVNLDELAAPPSCYWGFIPVT